MINYIKIDNMTNLQSNVVLRNSLGLRNKGSSLREQPEGTPKSEGYSPREFLRTIFDCIFLILSIYIWLIILKINPNDKDKTKTNLILR